MTEEEKALQGMLFLPGDAELVEKKRKAHNLNTEYNATREEETEKRGQILKELLGAQGESCRMQGPIYFHYGSHTRVGDRFFANFNLTVQDDASVTIGDDCNFGPGVTLVTAMHPMLAKERREMKDAQGQSIHACYAKPIVVGNDCWFGANVIVCPGVTIGDNCVIGAGSVVTRDVPEGSFAAGNPCRVIRPLTEADSLRHHPEILGDCQVE